MFISGERFHRKNSMMFMCLVLITFVPYLMLKWICFKDRCYLYSPFFHPDQVDLNGNLVTAYLSKFIRVFQQIIYRPEPIPIRPFMRPQWCLQTNFMARKILLHLVPTHAPVNSLLKELKEIQLFVKINLK